MNPISWPLLVLLPFLPLRRRHRFPHFLEHRLRKPFSAAILDQPQYQDSFFAVEIDTSFDPSLGNINANHIKIDLSTVVSFASLDALSHGVYLMSGKVINAWMNLSKQLKEFMHVGFSTSNGRGSGIHVIEHWQFKTLDYGSREETSKVSIRLLLSEIKYATMRFNHDKLVGEGASAKIYKRSLQHGGDVLVKRFANVDGLDWLHNPFRHRICHQVSYLRHNNLVQLKE
ncbi:hypothetical protein AHAS_Ahas16G0123000 [Arachis hypogaea]